MEVKELPYGENMHQKACLEKLETSVDYEILSRDKELGYIDYLNLSQALLIMGEFFDVHSSVIVKENSICAVSLGADTDNAFEKVIDCDPLSVINSTVGFSKELNLNCAKILKSMKIKNVIAPSYSKEAFSFLLDSGINIVAVKTPLHELQGFSEKDVKITPFGALVQEQNISKLTKETFTVVSKVKPSQQQAEDGIFAWKVAKHLKSKACVVAKELSTKSIVQGKTNDIISAELAMDCACEHSKDSVLVVDGVINNVETINAAIQGRVGLIIEAGDGKNSQNILKLADKYGISVIFTKIRNNKY